MSEQKEPAYAPLWLVIFNVILLIALVSVIAFDVDSKLRDLQRRIAVLESRSK